MRDGNVSVYVPFRRTSKRLNEGWPECGMETHPGFLVSSIKKRLNEGWPECGMETASHQFDRQAQQPV